jgi:hypothetical protein
MPVKKMKMKISGMIATSFLLTLAAAAGAQMTPWLQWTFLPPPQMDEIIGEASGETAFNHVVVMGGFARDRKEAEYGGTFWEARHLLDSLKEYGLAEAEILRFPGGVTWDGVAGELWEVSPNRQKLASYTDLRAMLASGSNPADVEAELVWVGEGELEDFANLEVKDKIVLTSGSAGAVHGLACIQRGAAGVVSFASPRPLFDPLLIPWGGIGGRSGGTAKFAFNLPPREGVILRDRLKRGEKVVVRAKVESASRKYELQDVVAAIPGTDAGGQEVILTAHLFEGYTMFGASDNYSGCAAILEAARTLQTLIREGRLPAPRRTIRFLWGPEFSGTVPYVREKKDRMRRTLCDINLDMVGLQLSKSRAFFTMMRTTFGNPHYVNDVLENYFRYVGETNRSYVTNGMSGALGRRIIAPSGTDEPMPYYVGTHFGSSDHEVFNDWGVGVPGVVLNTWPDMWFHTSADRPDKLDPTQLKRAVVIAAAAAYTIAAADEALAGRIASEVASNASSRLGHQLARALEELERSGTADFPAAWKRGRGYLEATARNERATLDSVSELAPGGARLGPHLQALKETVSAKEKAEVKAFEAQLRFLAAERGLKLVEPKPIPVEVRAAGLVPKPLPKVKEGGYQGYQAAIQEVLKQAAAAPSGRPALRNASEIQLLCDGRNSALDIKKALDTQFREETPLEGILGYLEVLKKAGLVSF